MINRTRRTLILLYTCSTGLILTAFLIFVLVLSNQQLLENKKELFQNNCITITQNVATNYEISQTWLAEIEIKNHFIIHIEDGGQALIYKGAWAAKTDRTILVNKVKDLARKDGINTDIKPVSTYKKQSKLYKLNGNNKDVYLAEVFMAPSDMGYRSVIMLQDISDNKTVIKLRVLMLVLYISGLAELFLVSRWIVGKSLKPVEESRKRQTEFVAAASHELKSPLAVIRANASAMLLEPEKTEHFSKGIDKECMRLSALIEDMLLLAAADANKWCMKKELIDMDLLLIDTYDTFSPFLRENKKELKLELQEEMLPHIEGDTFRIKQILAVLMDNATSYSIENDTIILRAYAKKNHLWIEIEDHGVGINQDKKNEVFERFYKGDRSRQDKNHYGLGLSIAKELTELQGGRISLKDTEGGGATFIISFPIR